MSSFAVTSITAVDATCNVAPGWFGFSVSSTQGQIVMNTALDYASCQNGFRAVVTVTRSDSATQFASGFGTVTATCAIDVEVLQVARPPIITDCSDRAVNERSISGSAIGGPILATNPNIGTSLIYSLNATLSKPFPPAIPLSIGLCDGQLRVLKTFLWRDIKQVRTH